MPGLRLAKCPTQFGSPISRDVQLIARKELEQRISPGSLYVSPGKATPKGSSSVGSGWTAASTPGDKELIIGFVWQ